MITDILQGAPPGGLEKAMKLGVQKPVVPLPTSNRVPPVLPSPTSEKPTNKVLVFVYWIPLFQSDKINQIFFIL